jgi:hypothetical protein
VIFQALARSTIIERFSARNNLIRNGLIVQNALLANPRLMNIDIEYNDIQFKIYTNIHRLLKDHLRDWQAGQKDRIRGVSAQQVENQRVLDNIRKAIRRERDEMEQLAAKITESENAKQEAEAKMSEHLAELEQKLAKITETANDELLRQRDQLDALRGRLGIVESETGGLTSKRDREVLNYARYCKGLKTAEDEVEALKVRAAEEKGEMIVRLKDTKAKYLDAQQGLMLRYEMLMDEKRMAQMEEEAARAAEALAAQGDKKGKRKGKGGGKGKGKGKAGAKGKAGKAKEGPAPEAESQPEQAPSPAAVPAQDVIPTVPPDLRAATTKGIPIVPATSASTDGPSSARRPR